MTNTSDSPNFRALCAELVVTWDAKSDLGFSDFRDKLSDIVARARSAGPWLGRNVAPPPEAPTDEEIMGLMPQQMHEDLATAVRAMAEQEGIDSTPAKGIMRIILNRHIVDLVRAALEKWGRASMDDDDCISPQDLHDIACSLSEGRKGLRKHIVYFQDEGKDKGIGVWAKNEEEAEILAMEKYCQLKKARAT